MAGSTPNSQNCSRACATAYGPQVSWHCTEQRHGGGHAKSAQLGVPSRPAWQQCLRGCRRCCQAEMLHDSWPPTEQWHECRPALITAEWAIPAGIAQCCKAAGFLEDSRLLQLSGQLLLTSLAGQVLQSRGTAVRGVRHCSSVCRVKEEQPVHGREASITTQEDTCMHATKPG